MSVIGSSFLNNISLIQRLTDERRTMVVDYFVVTEPDRAVTLKKIDTVKKETKFKVAEAPKPEKSVVDEKKPVMEVKPASNTNVVKRETVTKPETKAIAAIRAIEKKHARVKSTKGYINYFSLIRERIRARLKANYRNYHREGEAQLLFVLNADGALVAAEADKAVSTASDALINIALVSIREAAPFPRFPKSLSLPQMSFNLVVSFKKE